MEGGPEIPLCLEGAAEPGRGMWDAEGCGMQWDAVGCSGMEAHLCQTHRQHQNPTAMGSRCVGQLQGHCVWTGLGFFSSSSSPTRAPKAFGEWMFSIRGGYLEGNDFVLPSG